MLSTWNCSLFKDPPTYLKCLYDSLSCFNGSGTGGWERLCIGHGLICFGGFCRGMPCLMPKLCSTQQAKIMWQTFSGLYWSAKNGQKSQGGQELDVHWDDFLSLAPTWVVNHSINPSKCFWGSSTCWEATLCSHRTDQHALWNVLLWYGLDASLQRWKKTRSPWRDDIFCRGCWAVHSCISSCYLE